MVAARWARVVSAPSTSSSVIVGRIEFSTHPLVTGAKITFRIASRTPVGLGFSSWPQPRPLGAVRRDQHPFAAQGIEATMRMFLKIKIHRIGILTFDHRCPRSRTRTEDCSFNAVCCPITGGSDFIIGGNLFGNG